MFVFVHVRANTNEHQCSLYTCSCSFIPDQELKCFEPKIKHFGTRANELDEVTCTETFESLETMWNDINSDYANHEEKLKDALRQVAF